MAYTELVYKLVGEDKEVEVIGETMMASQSYFIAQDDYLDSVYLVYSLTEDEELEIVEDENIAEVALRNWKEETYGLLSSSLWDDEDNNIESHDGFDSVEDSLPLMSDTFDEDFAEI